MNSQRNRKRSISRRLVLAGGVFGGTISALGSVDIFGSSALAQQQTESRGLTTPIPLQVPATEGTADLGNTRLYYWDTGGPGEVVVLLHPGSGSAEFYPYQQPVFAKAGFRVISYSRRGQYKSELGNDADTYFAADDLLNLMKYLNVDKFHAVGNALGAYIALDIAISQPERLHSTVLACSMLGIAEPEYKAISESLRPKAFMDMPVEVKELGPSYRAANPAGVAEWKKLNERSGKGIPVRLRNKITWEMLGKLTVPILLITGGADMWIPPYLLRRVAEKIPNSKVIIIVDSGHGVQWEQPQAFNEAVLDFMRSKALR